MNDVVIATAKRPRGRPRKNAASPNIHVIPGISKEEVEDAVNKSQNRLKVYIYPSFGELDKGDGGIRRVVEGQIKHLPKYGIEIVQEHAQADVIAYHATVPPAFIKLYPDKTFVAICHGLYWSEYEWENWALKMNAEVIEGIQVSDAVITCSQWVANALRRHSCRVVDVIPHGIDIEEWEPNEDQRDYVLWNKTRPDPICDSEPMNQVAARLPNVKFISTFGEKASNIAITGKLPFEEAKILIQKAGVYLCTTRETFGIGTIEAMASGVPVVGFNWGGQAEILRHGVDSWLVTPGDIEGLAEGIQWALDNRKEAGEAARERVKRLFTWEKACEKYATVFQIAHQRKQREVPKTSIIVTAYKLEQFLPDALESVRNQTSQDWECIIVDDASPDSCGQIAEEYAKADTRFKVIHNAKNSYLAESRNIGIRASKGKYILPLDADDMLTPEAVKILSEALDIDRSIHVAYGGVYFIEADGTPSEYGPRYTPGHSGWPMQFSFEQQIMQRNLLPYSSMYRREAWEYTGGYRRRCRTAEDAEMWTRFSSYGFRPKKVTENDTLVYRNRPGSMSREQGYSNWTEWFTWAKDPKLTPAAAVTKAQLPVASLDPIIISVIIPVGPGHAKIVLDAIDSLDSQTFKNWECIVVNDTGELLATELPQWVKLIDTEGRTGPAHARNVGIKASKGKLFLPLDADDYLEPEALDLMYYAYRASKAVIYSDFWEDKEGDGVLTIYQCPDYDANLLKRKGSIHTVTALTPKEYWEAVGGYDESLPAWEDWDFQLLLADKGYCSQHIPIPLFTYRKGTGFRREQNMEFFAQSKEGILSKWGDIWNGRKELMACSSCGANRGRAQMPSTIKSVAKSPPSEEAVLITYTGNKQGATPYRGVSGTMYWFAAGEGPKYVLAKDLEMFRKYGHEFEIMSRPSPEENRPILVASGPPA